MSMGTMWARLRLYALVGAAMFALVAVLAAGGAPAGAAIRGDVPQLRPGTEYPEIDEESEEHLFEQDRDFVAGRTAGDDPLDVAHAGQLRAKAAHAAKKLGKTAPPAGPATFSGAWSPTGPKPIGEYTRSSFTLAAMNGRIGALAVRPSTGQIILGGAQGGIWLFDGTSWTPRTNDQETQAVGALAIAPSDDATVYAGTGEGALSGDSYYGNGVLRSTDGGKSWTHVSGDYFQGVSVSRIVVDPTNARHLYAAVLRGRGGSRRVTVQPHSRYGIWESTDGGATWTLRREVDEGHGATDLEMDPQNPKVLYASFWTDGIYKSTDGGRSWTQINNFGLPSPDFSDDARFGLSISHPNPGGDGTLYTGFAWKDANGEHPSRVWKSTNGGASWTELPDGDGGPHGEADAVENYCDIQCSYDNVIEADPNNPDVVFAAGEYGYDLSPQSGGIFRSDDGGQTWKNLGWDLHPDFHAFAWDPSKAGHVVIGNDGGVWRSNTYGGRPTRDTPLSAVNWSQLNSQGLAIAQFSSIATNPTDPGHYWGGTQDNGTMQEFDPTDPTWYDMTSGDGGQVLVDPTDYHYVYGTYYGISPYRITDGGAVFFSNKSITNGIDLDDRSEFYTPWVLNFDDPNQLFLGTDRIYRTDNAKAPSAGDVLWKPVSDDLTSGCPGAAPNGGRGCVVSAVGIGGGDAAYAGTEEGWVWVSPDAQTADSPTWTRLDAKGKTLPHRPVATFAVDRSNYRTAYAGFNGFDAATPKTPGHVFKTTDGGKSWTNITSNLPDVPVNSLVLDPSYANTIYAGTDVGPFVTYDGGAHWGTLGSGFPRVAVWQLDMDPSHRTMAAGSHGRSAFAMDDGRRVPALELSKVSADVPVGPDRDLEYTITLRNIGNGPATGVKITDPVPDDTTFVSASDGGTLSRGTVTWDELAVPAGSSRQVKLTVHVSPKVKKATSVTNDGYKATSAEGPSATGSPVTTRFAPPYAVGVAPATQTAGARDGTAASYVYTIRNRGSNADSYTVSATGTYQAATFAADCTTPLTTTPTLAPGATSDVCVKVTVPAGAPDRQTDTTTVKATSVGDPTVSATATATTIAVGADTLLVDDDTNSPVDSAPYYKAALTDAGVPFSTWDLAEDPDIPARYLTAFKNVVWFTGNSYPGPLLPYETRLKGFLDGGGHLFVSGQDLLDQGAGTTDFVHDYLHVSWDGTEAQNDKPTSAVRGVAGSPVTDGIGAVALNHSVLQATFEDQVTPNGGATPAFTDDSGAADALSFAGGYKVVFLAFPMEAYGTAAQRADLVGRVMAFFGS